MSQVTHSRTCGAGQQQELCFLGPQSSWQWKSLPQPQCSPQPPSSSSSSSSVAPHQITADREIPDQEITGCASCKANPMTSQRALTGLWDGRDPWPKFHAFHCAGVSFDEQNSPVCLANVTHSAFAVSRAASCLIECYLLLASLIHDRAVMRHLFCKSIQILQAAYRHSKVNEMKFPEDESLWVLLQVWRQFHSNPFQICFLSFSPQ